MVDAGLEDAGSLLVSDGGEDRITFGRSLSVGRHVSNDLVLGQAQVSSHHAVLEWAPDGWRIRDLGSRNGTTVNGRRIQNWRSLKVGDVIRFAGVSSWRAQHLASPDRTAQPLALVERVSSGRRVPVRRDRFLLGTGRPCDLRVTEWLEDAVSPIRAVLFQESGVLFVESAAGVPGIEIGQGSPTEGAATVEDDLVLRLGPTELRVLPLSGGSSGMTQTAALRAKEYDLDLYLDFDGTTEGTVRVVNDDGEWTVRTGQRFIVLYLLAQAGGAWVEDSEIKTGLWGRIGAQQTDRSALNKLLHDTRQMFLARGVDGWFIEKRRGATRLRLPRRRIHVAGPGDTPPS